MTAKDSSPSYKVICLENPLLGKAHKLSYNTFKPFASDLPPHRYPRRRVCKPLQRPENFALDGIQNFNVFVALPYRDEAMLQKYGIKADDAILAEEKHMGIFEDLLQNHNAKLIAGGAAQNTARGAQVCSSLVAYRKLRYIPDSHSTLLLITTSILSSPPSSTNLVPPHQ